MAIVSIFIAMFSVQLGASLAKTLFPIIGPVTSTVLRISIAAVILAAIWRPWRHRLSKRAYRAVALYGAGLGIMNLAFYLALTRIPLGICVALEFTGPLSVALLASRQTIDFLWACLAALGIVLILPIRIGPEGLDPLGVGLALLTGACWAFYIVQGKKVGGLVRAGVATSIGMIVAAIVTLPFGLLATHVSDLSPRVFGLGAMVAVLSSAIPYSFEMYALKEISAKTYGILMSIEPAVAALFGFIFLRESLSLVQCLAILSVVTASAGSAMTSRRQSREALVGESLP